MTRSNLQVRRWGIAAACVTLLLLMACRGRQGRAGSSKGPVPPTAHPTRGRSLGLNVSGVDYWGQEWTFVDLVKRAKDWGEKPGGNYTVDKDGWITSMAPGSKRVALIGDPDLHFQRNFPIGRYVALYDGQGELSIDCQRCRALGILGNIDTRRTVPVPALLFSTKIAWPDRDHDQRFLRKNRPDE